ncbi:DUF1361 domain-containing protein [Enterococcus caccae]|nr:DUF1361 domain-containing protein [Enterococcus caccae]
MIFFAEMYHFMALNVLLAYTPLEISFHLKKVQKRMFYLLGMFWLLFYPNAPYLFTDFFHLEQLTIYQGMNQIFGQALSDWVSFSLLTVGICVYGFLGMATVFTVLNESIQRNIFIKKWQEFIFILLINVLSSLAIFVGRFNRLHSVYVFTKPIQTVKIIFFDWSLNKMLFILLLTIVQIMFLAAIFGLKGLKLIED